MFTIDLTEAELTMILDCVGNRIEDLQNYASDGDGHLVAEEIETLRELDIDLREALNRDEFFGERFNDAIGDAEAQFIDAGIVAREMQKEERRSAFADSDIRTGSLAAKRREACLRIERMMLGTATPFVEEE